MGYSIHVACKSIKAQQKMRTFLDQHLTPFYKLFPNEKYNPDYDYTQYVCCGPELSYGAKSLSLGWNYSMAGDSNHYLWCLLKFVALRVGRTRTLNGATLPYIDYDGSEKFTVADCDLSGWQVNPEIESCEDYCNDSTFPFVTRLFFANKIKKLKQQDPVIKVEMERLADLWSQLDKI